MPKCNTCPLCGANLDFGERCDCKEDLEKKTLPLEDTTKDKALSAKQKSA